MAKKVALLLGGWSAERQVSLEKGKKVEIALREAGYDVTVIDVKKDIPALVKALTPKPDAVFNNLHGGRRSAIGRSWRHRSDGASG